MVKIEVPIDENNDLLKQNLDVWLSHTLRYGSSLDQMPVDQFSPDRLGPCMARS